MVDRVGGDMGNDDKKMLSDELAQTEAIPADIAARFSKRRRFMMLGASSVPVALTLTSRPVLAWHCNSTSAWGSEQIRPNHSTIARNDDNELPDESWTIANWQQNTTRAGLQNPWAALGLQTTKSNKSDYYKNYKVSQLYAPYGGIPTGLSGNDGVWDKITNGTTFQKYMLVARLNSKFVTNIRTCLKNSNHVDQLVLMASGRYSPTNLPGKIWNQTDIISYLNNNWIVRPN